MGEQLTHRLGYKEEILFLI